MSLRSSYRLVCLFVVLSGWLWLGVQPAAAHAVPTVSNPPANEILATAPEVLQMSFSEPIVPAFSSIQILAVTGQPVETGPLTPIASDNTRVQIALPPLNNGSYVVSWRVLSAVDGHTTSGIFPFGVGVSHLSGAAQTATATPLPIPASLIARWANLIGVALLLGLFSFRLLLLTLL